MGSVSREMTGKEYRRQPKFPGLGASDDWDAFRAEKSGERS